MTIEPYLFQTITKANYKTISFDLDGFDFRSISNSIESILEYTNSTKTYDEALDKILGPLLDKKLYFQTSDDGVFVKFNIQPEIGELNFYGNGNFTVIIEGEKCLAPDLMHTDANYEISLTGQLQPSLLSQFLQYSGIAIPTTICIYEIKDSSGDINLLNGENSFIID